MRRHSRWETYDGGRRPDKARIVRDLVRRLHTLRTDSARWDLNVQDEELAKDLQKLRLETLAVLEDELSVNPSADTI